MGKAFIVEWMKCLAGFEKEILKLEYHSEDIELLDHIFKGVHSLKHGSSFLGLSGITRLSNEMEITLDAIKNRKVTVSTELIDSLLLSGDFLNTEAKRLNGILMEHHLENQNDVMYIEFECNQKEEQVLNALNLSCKNSEVNENEANMN